MIADLQSVRNAAIDEAIAVCEAEEQHVRALGLHMAVAACGTIADKLRGLKNTKPILVSEEISADARDAARYRWLRDESDSGNVGVPYAVKRKYVDGRYIQFAFEPAELDAAIDAIQPKKLPRFENVACSQCGGTFGPGEHGFSHCENHQGMSRTVWPFPKRTK